MFRFDCLPTHPRILGKTTVPSSLRPVQVLASLSPCT